MLVLSRHADETITLPTLGIKIRVLRISPNRVRIGIDAPQEVPILRGELSEAEVIDVSTENETSVVR